MADNTFDSWLCVKIRSLQLDEDVFLDYLKGVLEEETSPEEKIETIENILQGATDEPVANICNDMIQKWNEFSSSKIEAKPVNIDQGDQDVKILDIIHRQQETLTISKQEVKGGDELKRKVLEQYSHVSEDEDSDRETEPSQSSLFENINAKSVADQQKAQREKQKKASEEKKEKDKVNREAEKMKKQERIEKEKKRTQKGERRK